MSKPNQAGWQFWIDRGGTFTDVVALSPDGKIHTRKYLSINPSMYDDAALHAIEEIRSKSAAGNLPIDCIKMGTTIGTNALLERKGQPTVLVTNTGLADAFRIGYQNRPDIFALQIVLPDMLYAEVIEVDSRTAHDGTILGRLNREATSQALLRAYQRGLRSCAVVLMHAFRFPEQELEIASIALEIGFEHVSCSGQVSPLIKFISRGDTTLCDAYLSPLLKKYISQIRAGLPDAKLMFMQSNGGLAEAACFSGKDSILSGPAGGMIGAIKTAESCGFRKIVAFDMGGTSTDVSHYDGQLEHNFETIIAGVRLRSPILDIHTVAAGGGSILSFDGSRFRAGPDSAGALPGPLSYRNNGPLTVTDANLILGRIQPDFFPAVFGEHRDQPLDRSAVESEFAKLAEQVKQATGRLLTNEQLACGFLEIAVAKTANAIKQVSVQRGHDLSKYILSCFGGAGGQHACLIAESLGMRKVLIHPLAGVLSALGIGLADVVEFRQATINEPLADQDIEAFEQNRLQPLIKSCRQALLNQGIEHERIRDEVKVLLRYRNCDFSLAVDWAPADQMYNQFCSIHLRRYGFLDQHRQIFIDSISVRAIAAAQQPDLNLAATHTSAAQPSCQRALYSKGAWHQSPVYLRKSLGAESLITGPAIIADDNSTTVVDKQWEARVLADGTLLLDRHAGENTEPAAAGEDSENAAVPADPVKLELFNRLFMFIAEQMGITLQNTSYSVNIKERLDFSCAIFDRQGHLIANAPHIPVHLGSMGESVKNLLRRHGDKLQPGDVYATNDPFEGGTHLPDITVITPMFDRNGKLLFFTASRGHHADIGGTTPGSMPPDSTTIMQEGILITNLRIVSGGQFQTETILELLTSGPWPARNPEQNIADLKAQTAANARGIQELERAIAYWGEDRLNLYMGKIQDNAEECVRRAIDKLEPGVFQCRMDDGSVIAVSVSIDKLGRSARIDFTGTSAQHESNLNAPYAVTLAAVLYVFRTLVQDDIPLNAGCFRPLDIVIPSGCMLNPSFPAAVVAGNVETSQQIVDALFGALGVMAASQGTMNNFTFGDEHHQYYETICGGSGAGNFFHGCDAVQTHMTNSRLTDPEILETRFPVRVERFSLRSGSGGTGRFHGGNGVVRKLRFLKAMAASILSDRRKVAPHGLDGGSPGCTGRNYVERICGAIEPLAGKATVLLQAGEAFIVETPGGGGYGAL